MQEQASGAGVVPALPPSAPQVPYHPFARWFGRTVLRLGGWKVVGEFPDLPRVVLIGAPHTSNWDGVWGFAAKLALGLDVRILGKDSLFRVPVVGWLVRKLGVIPVDRSAPRGVVDQAVAMIRGSERLWYVRSSSAPPVCTDARCSRQIEPGVLQHAGQADQG